MALRPVEGQPEPSPVALEKWVKLAGEPEPTFHGALTSELHTILERVGSSGDPWGDLSRALKEALVDDYTAKVSDAERGRIIMADCERSARAAELIASLDERLIRESIAGLEHVIQRREEQGDYWPEGRLNLGIAYACLGQYEDAMRWLEDAANMLRYPSYLARSDHMAA